jgi:hypothetical protein
MPRRLRPEPLAFVNSAPLRLSYRAPMSASAKCVFLELTEDAARWPQWFREVSSASYAGLPPYGQGTGRRVRLRGGVRYVETILAWEEGERLAYRVEESNLPGLDAQIEEWRLEPLPEGGCMLYWTMAVDGAPALGLLLSGLRAPVGRAFRRAAARLDGLAGPRNTASGQ